MSVDLFQSRRNYNEFCRFWSRDERDEYTPDEEIIGRVPSGCFWAKESSAQTEQDVIVANSFMFGKTSTSIKTPDNVMELKAKDIVEFQGEYWIVENVQKSKAKMQNTQFGNDRNCSHFFYISLRK